VWAHWLKNLTNTPSTLVSSSISTPMEYPPASALRISRVWFFHDPVN
jgi:hypothetical protein